MIDKRMHDKRKGAATTMYERVIDGRVHVWSILDNAWVMPDYWRWVNGGTLAVPSLDEDWQPRWARLWGGEDQAR